MNDARCSPNDVNTSLKDVKRSPNDAKCSLNDARAKAKAEAKDNAIIAKREAEIIIALKIGTQVLVGRKPRTPLGEIGNFL
jgi:hypothetical protein